MPIVKPSTTVSSGPWSRSIRPKESSTGSPFCERSQERRSFPIRARGGGRRIVMTVPGKHNAKLRKIIELVNADDDLYALWTAANVNAVERLGMTDHGPVHVKIVMNIAVRILRLLMESGVEAGVVTNYRL